MSFGDLKVRGFMYEHVIKRSGVNVRGERKNSAAPLTLVVDKQGLWVLRSPCLDLNKNRTFNHAFPCMVNTGLTAVTFF